MLDGMFQGFDKSEGDLPISGKQQGDGEISSAFVCHLP
jgi:hypothetical protein